MAGAVRYRRHHARRDGESTTHRRRGEIPGGNFDSALTLPRDRRCGQRPGRLRRLRGPRAPAPEPAADAREAFEDLDAKPKGYLVDGDFTGEADEAVALDYHATAIELLQKLTGDKTGVNEAMLAQLDETARGRRPCKTAETLRDLPRFPLTDAATSAAAELEPLRDIIGAEGLQVGSGPGHPVVRRAPLHRRARRLCRVAGLAHGDDRELVDLRIAESDFILKRHAASRDGVRPCTESASRKPRRDFFYVSAMRELGRDDEFQVAGPRPRADFPDSSWAEEALNNLGTYYILNNDDELAASLQRAVREVPDRARAPSARRGSPAGGYKTGDYAETVRVFEAAAAVPALGLPSILPLLGGRAHGKLGAGERRRAAPARVHRLRQLVLRPPRRTAAVAERQTTLAADAEPAARLAALRRRRRPCEP